MKINDVLLNTTLYALNSVPDGQLYHVVHVNGFLVHLNYASGSDCDPLDAGWIDICALRKPTKAQKENHKLAGSH